MKLENLSSKQRVALASLPGLDTILRNMLLDESPLTKEAYHQRANWGQEGPAPAEFEFPPEMVDPEYLDEQLKKPEQLGAGPHPGRLADLENDVMESYGLTREEAREHLIMSGA